MRADRQAPLVVPCPMRDSTETTTCVRRPRKPAPSDNAPGKDRSALHSGAARSQAPKPDLIANPLQCAPSARRAAPRRWPNGPPAASFAAPRCLSPPDVRPDQTSPNRAIDPFTRRAAVDRPWSAPLRRLGPHRESRLDRPLDRAARVDGGDGATPISPCHRRAPRVDSGSWLARMAELADATDSKSVAL